MKQDKTKQLFQNFGLGKHSHEVYESITKNGPILAHHIIKSTGLHRPVVYSMLNNLQKAGLIKTTKQGKRNLWSITDASKVAELFTTESKIVNNLIDSLPKKKTIENEKVTLINGKDAITKVFDDVLESTPKGDTFYRYTSEQDTDYVNSLLPKDYRERRDKKRLERLVISNPISGNKKRPRLERFIKFIPPEVDLFDQNIIQLIYGDKLAMIDIKANEAFIIENKALASFQKVIFQQLYNKLHN